MIAKRNIQKGEEITYDYSTTETDPAYEDNWDCRCRAKNCRGKIKSTDCLNVKFQEMHKNHLPISTLEFIKNYNN